jgi:hypothetical protein
VEQPVGVGGVEGAGDRAQDLDGARGLERPLPGEHRLEVDAVDVLHDHVQDVVLLTRVEQLDDVGVV